MFLKFVEDCELFQQQLRFLFGVVFAYIGKRYRSACVDVFITGNLALSRALGDFVFKKNNMKQPEEQIVTGL